MLTTSQNTPIESDQRNVYTSKRGDVDYTAEDVDLISYSAAGDGPAIMSEFDEHGVPTRVVPFKQLVVDDIPVSDALGSLKPIAPLPRAPRPRGIYFWVVLQGARIGIFEGSASVYLLLKYILIS